MTAVLTSIAPSSMLDRFTVIIDCFDGGAGLLTLDEIAGRTGLPRSSAHRILDQLVRLEWLTHCARGYGLGVRARPWPTVPAGDMGLRAAAPALHDLLMHTGAVVHLGMLDRGDIVHLDKLGGPAAAQVPTAVGARVPAHRVALGVAALAGIAPEDVITEINQGGSGFEPGPRWWAELHRARSAVVIRDDDYTTGMVSAAAAVGCRAAVGIVASPARLGHRERCLVAAAAAQITRRLATRP